jgi:hypothetical protein
MSNRRHIKSVFTFGVLVARIKVFAKFIRSLKQLTRNTGGAAYLKLILLFAGLNVLTFWKGTTPDK